MTVMELLGILSQHDQHRVVKIYDAEEGPMNVKSVYVDDEYGNGEVVIDWEY